MTAITPDKSFAVADEKSFEPVSVASRDGSFFAVATHKPVASTLLHYPNYHWDLAVFNNEGTLLGQWGDTVCCNDLGMSALKRQYAVDATNTVVGVMAGENVNVYDTRSMSLLSTVRAGEAPNDALFTLSQNYLALYATNRHHYDCQNRLIIQDLYTAQKKWSVSIFPSVSRDSLSMTFAKNNDIFVYCCKQINAPEFETCVIDVTTWQTLHTVAGFPVAVCSARFCLLLNRGAYELRDWAWKVIKSDAATVGHTRHPPFSVTAGPFFRHAAVATRGVSSLMAVTTTVCWRSGAGNDVVMCNLEVLEATSTEVRQRLQISFAVDDTIASNMYDKPATSPLLSFSRSGDWLVCGYAGHIRLWSCASWAETKVLARGTLVGCHFLGDKSIVSVASHKVVTLWSIKSAEDDSLEHQPAKPSSRAMAATVFPLPSKPSVSTKVGIRTDIRVIRLELAKHAVQDDLKVDVTKLQLDNSDAGKLGKGAMGVVSRGTYKRLPVAVKQPFGSDEFDVAMQTELANYRKLAKQNNEHVVLLVGWMAGIGTTAGRLVMELCDGGTLEQFVSEETRLEVTSKRFITLAKHMALGLLFVHGNGIIHSDVKPANVLLDTNGVAKLGDFGVSKALRTTQHAATSLNGYTLQYTPAEALATESSGANGAPKVKLVKSTKIDVWLFACVLLAISGGRHPWRGKSPIEVQMALLSLQSPALHNGVRADERVRTLLVKCLDSNSTHRPPAGMLVSALNELRSGKPVASGSTSKKAAAPAAAKLPSQESSNRTPSPASTTSTTSSVSLPSTVLRAAAQSMPNEVESWTEEHVKQFFSQLSLKRNYDAMVDEQCIDGELLMTLPSDDDWKEMGVTLLRDRKLIIKAVQFVLSLEQ